MSTIHKTTDARIVQFPTMKEIDAEVNKITFTLSTDVETQYVVLLEPDESGRIIATCPKLQGVVADGANEKEVIENVRDAINAVLEDMDDEKEFNIVSYYL